uniref:Variant surface glycoprotein 1293 n=1 Tax=Trypanosoma brucei TaxID=5691 RepID=M4SZV9_9TRYP|nr:variant surface glycoprotein 1293 [Trypanosoma brucei]
MTLARRHIAIWLPAFIAAAGVRASSPGFTEAGVQKLCGIAADLANVAGIGKAKLQQQKTELEAAINARATLALAALNAASGDEATIYAAAAEAAATCSRAAASQLEVLTNKAIAATRAAANAAGRLSGVIEILLQATNQNKNAGKCIVQGNSNTKTTKTTLAALGCPTTTDDDTEDKRLADLKNLKQTGFASLKNAETITSAGSGNGVCAFLTGSSNAATHMWDHGGGSANSATIGHGMLKLSFDNTDSSAKAETLKLDALGDWGSTDSTENGKLFKAIGALETTAVHSCGGNTQAAVKTFLQPQTLQAFLAPAYKKTGEQTAEKQATDAINKAANKATATADDLKTLLDKVDIPTLNNGEIATKPLKQLNYDVTGTAHLLSSLLQLKAKSETSTICPKFNPKEGGKSSTETAETCKAKGVSAKMKMDVGSKMGSAKLK